MDYMGPGYPHYDSEPTAGEKFRRMLDDWSFAVGPMCLLAAGIVLAWGFSN